MSARRSSTISRTSRTRSRMASSIWWHRITKDGGVVVLRTPHFSRGFSHPEHQRGFDVSFPLYFRPRFKGGYQGVEYELKDVRLTWFAQKYLKASTLSPLQYCAGVCLGGVLSFLAGLSPYACSRVWCFWVGGFEEIMFRLAVKKARSPVGQIPGEKTYLTVGSAGGPGRPTPMLPRRVVGSQNRPLIP